MYARPGADASFDSSGVRPGYKVEEEEEKKRKGFLLGSSMRHPRFEEEQLTQSHVVIFSSPRWKRKECRSSNEKKTAASAVV